jgi:hypothetical protein
LPTRIHDGRMLLALPGRGKVPLVPQPVRRILCQGRF